MRSALVLLFLTLLSECPSLTQQATLPQPEKASSWPETPLHSNLMVENPGLFSPRMDYDEWTPLGRGDPLKNDPTYDYVPPVLERVHYWMDPSKRTPDPPLSNSALLLLASRTESAFTTRPTTPRYHSFQSKESQADSRIDTSSLLDPFFKLMDVSQFNLNFNSNANYKPVPNRIHRPHYQTSKQRTQPPQALQRPPYTMLMPPPPPPPSPSPTPFQPTNYITTVPDHTRTTAPVPPTLNPPLSSRNATTINPSALANTENVFKPVAISMPDHAEAPENETQNEVTVSTLKKTTTEPTLTPAETTQRPKHATKQDQQQPAMPYTKPGHKEHANAQPRPLGADEKVVKKPAKAPQRHWGTENRATITPPVTTTKTNSLTTDPMFKHYRHPSEPVKGPFYLIIQGHSKVKTYGASKNPVNKLLTSNEIKYDEEVKKNKLERKTRRLRYETITPGGANGLEEHREETRSLRAAEEGDSGSLEDTFGKSKGGNSKKRYLGSSRRRKRSIYDSITLKSRRLLSERADVDCGAEGRNATLSADNLDLESLIAISDDYDPEDVANILLKEEGGQGSGFGGLAASILSRSQEDVEEM